MLVERVMLLGEHHWEAAVAMPARWLGTCSRAAHVAQAAATSLSSASVCHNPVFHPQGLSACSPRSLDASGH